MKIVMLFPGFGSQFVGMGKELYDEFRVVQEYFEEASNCLNINFIKLCFASSDVELSKMVNAYTSLFLIGSSTYALLKQEEIIPDIVVGYNNGEYAALFAGGGFSFPDGLYLQNKFCLFYQDALDEMDVEVVKISGISTQQLEDICVKARAYGGAVSIAIYNSAMEHVVTGNTAQIEQVREMIGEMSAVTIDHLGLEIGLHSALMNQVVDQFKIYLEKVDFRDLQISLMSSLDGQIVEQGEEIKRRLMRHINSPLVFNRVVKRLVDYDVIIVASPADQLSALVKKYYPQKHVVSVQKGSDIETIKSIIAKQ